MIKRLPILYLALLALLAGCGNQLVGQRFRAERALWNANQETKRLTIRPSLVTEDQWYGLAARYEGIASEYGTVPVLPDSTEEGIASREIHIIVARALLNAAQLHSAVRDSLRMMELFERVASEFADVPQVAAEVALAQAGIAEGNGDWEKALDAYQRVLDNAPPRPGEIGVGAVVMELPVRMARIRANQAGASSPRDPFYEEAISYYETMIEAHPDSRVAIEARRQLATVATDLQDWNSAIQELRSLEGILETFPEPSLDPGEVRFTIASIQNQDPTKSSEEPAKTLQSILQDYPDSPYIPKTLLALANLAATEGELETSFRYLDQIREEHSDEEVDAAQAMLFRGRLLEANGRWAEALEVFRALPVHHAITESALQAHMEIVAHYKRTGDEEGTKAALEKAEREYREYIVRYPQGWTSFTARRLLAQTLALQEKYADAVTEMVDLGEALLNTRQGAALMINAAKMAYLDLEDTTMAADILDRVGTLYARAELGRWASSEATRLRGEMIN
jgi:tetratricopeptide (TPR) repeat protein